MTSTKTLITLRRHVPICQMVLHLNVEGGLSERVYKQAKGLIMGWFEQKSRQKKLGLDFSNNQDGFHLKSNGWSFRVTGDPEEGAWATRLEHPDKEYPNNTWVVETALQHHDEGVLLGLKAGYWASKGTNDPGHKSIPGLVKNLVQTIGFRDGYLVKGEFVRINSRAEIEQLIKRVEGEELSQQIVVIGEGTHNLSKPHEKFLLNPCFLANRLAGVAQVFAIHKKFLSQWVSAIEGSSACMNGGLVVIDGSEVVFTASRQEIRGPESHQFSSIVVSQVMESALYIPTPTEPLRFLGDILRDR